MLGRREWCWWREYAVYSPRDHIATAGRRGGRRRGRRRVVWWGKRRRDKVAADVSSNECQANDEASSTININAGNRAITVCCVHTHTSKSKHSDHFQISPPPSQSPLHLFSGAPSLPPRPNGERGFSSLARKRRRQRRGGGGGEKDDDGESLQL